MQHSPVALPQGKSQIVQEIRSCIHPLSKVTLDSKMYLRGTKSNANIGYNKLITASQNFPLTSWVSKQGKGKHQNKQFNQIQN